MPSHPPSLSRRASPRLVRQSGATSFGLPRELLDKGRERLRVILLLTLFATVLSFAVRLSRAVDGPEAFARERIGMIYVGAAGLSAALFLLLVRVRSQNPAFALRLGLFFEVLLGYTVAIGSTIQEAVKYGHVPYLTWAVPLVVAFPLVVPSPPRLTVFAAIATSTSAWVAVWVASTLNLLQATLATYVEVAVSPIVATVVAYFGSRVIYGLNLDYAEAMRAGSYVLKEKLGDGGMGEVWRAEHQLLARPAAVKLVRPELLERDPASRDALLARFKREAKVTALLRSPHAVELYDYGVNRDGVFFYVMELLDGLDLDSLVTRYGPMPPERAVHILKQVTSSLAEAHENNLIHRDVKPANIYVCQYGLTSDFVKVLDFGLVKAERKVELDDDTETNLSSQHAIHGSPAFISPEQISGAFTVGPASDVYSLGCTAYWLLTGKLVFEASSAMEMMICHLRTQPNPPSQATKQTIPEELDRLVLGCLAKTPSDRPQSMLELGEALSAIPLEQEWDQTRALEWWRQHAPQVAARRTSYRAKRQDNQPARTRSA